jgi:hypothetical protein
LPHRGLITDQRGVFRAGVALSVERDEQTIRPIRLREFAFLIAHGAAAIYALVPLATLFDPTSPNQPDEVERHSHLMADVIIDGLRQYH